MRVSKRPTSEIIVELLLSAGFIPIGTTKTEHVRISTRKCPVFGGIGGKKATFGGRQRYQHGDQRVTVGKRTVCFYRVESGKPTNFKNYDTKDYDEISDFIRRQ